MPREQRAGNRDSDESWCRENNRHNENIRAASGRSLRVAEWPLPPAPLPSRPLPSLPPSLPPPPPPYPSADTEMSLRPSCEKRTPVTTSEWPLPPLPSLPSFPSFPSPPSLLPFPRTRQPTRRWACARRVRSALRSPPPSGRSSTREARRSRSQRGRAACRSSWWRDTLRTRRAPPGWARPPSRSLRCNTASASRSRCCRSCSRPTGHYRRVVTEGSLPRGRYRGVVTEGSLPRGRYRGRRRYWGVVIAVSKRRRNLGLTILNRSPPDIAVLTRDHHKLAGRVDHHVVHSRLADEMAIQHKLELRLLEPVSTSSDSTQTGTAGPGTSKHIIRFNTNWYCVSWKQ